MPTTPPAAWDDAAVRSPGGHVLQSTAWARIREAQGWRAEYVRVGDPLPVALVLWRDALPGRPIAYVPRGPIVAPDDAHGLRSALERLGSLARERGALFLKADPELEPERAADPLRDAGYRRSPQEIQPVLATLELSLEPDEDVLMGAMEKDTRWSVRQAAKRGVEIREASDESSLRAFYDLYSLTGERAHFITRTWAYYRAMWGTLVSAGLATVRIASVDGRPAAAAMVWRCGERALYQTAATNDAGRRAYAAYGLLWECMLAAKREGFRRFDFGGIPVDTGRKDDPMYGPYHFKRGFGGTPRRWVGAHDVVPSAALYRAYLLAEPIYTAALRAVGRLRR